jgi:hypothetical protein
LYFSRAKYLRVSLLDSDKMCWQSFDTYATATSKTLQRIGRYLNGRNSERMHD